jgi:aminoglycoside 6'-N-acetyltransferase I
MATTIRPAQKRDLEAWAGMRARLWPDAGAGHAGELATYFDDPDSLKGLVDRAWVALEAGEYLGFAEASIRPGANGCESQPVPFLEGIWVEPGARRKGFGRELLQAVEAWARELGFTELGSDAELDNRVSLAWHSGQGFEEMERVVCYRKKLGP